MLKHLHIKNFTLIEDLELDFAGGMTAITGETGAGKSIIIDAIEIALGQRASADLVRHGHPRADICLGFDISQQTKTTAWLQSNELEDGQECMVRRTLTREGRSKSYINGTPVNLAVLRQLAEKLINIHGQHESQALLKADLQRDLLDQFARHQPLMDKVRQHFDAWQVTSLEYHALKNKEHEAKSRAEYLNYQIEELNALSFSQDELSSLEQKHKTLAHADQLLQHCQEASTFLSDDENAAITQLTRALHNIETAAEFAAPLKNTQAILNNALIAAEEAYSELQHYLGQLSLDPAQLKHLETRLASAHDIARKHHIEIPKIPDMHEQLQKEYDQLTHCDEHLDALYAALIASKKQYLTCAKQLTQSRTKQAKQLSQLVTDNMQKLGMAAGTFHIELLPYTDEKPRAHGSEKINFLVATNPGLPPQALNKTASGGELSRISLAIQVITSQFAETPSLVFDEVDTGVGGATAEIVGELLKKLAHSAQVLCITHLAQVAAKADQHMQVSKHHDGKTTSSCITALDPAQRVEEIARMSGGVKITQETLAHARALLIDSVVVST
jgi:DNA repair protein RecN (Recombination protein N)